MIPRKSLFLGAVAGCIALSNPVLAQTPPGIESVSLQCLMAGTSGPPVTLTVQVTFVSNVFGPLAFKFRDVATGQTTTYTPMVQGTTQMLPVPPGTYNLAVASISGQNPEPIWGNIVVPPTVSTNGKGTGCAFSHPPGRPFPFPANAAVQAR